jgi:hypothetical protein
MTEKNGLPPLRRHTHPGGLTADLHDRNTDQPWDDFDPTWYLAHNYAELRFDDRQLLQWTGDFFAEAKLPQLGHGIDIGTGANLYPSLAMLPLCHRLTLVEQSMANVAWLTAQVPSFADTWEPFWGTLVNAQPSLYKGVSPRSALEVRAEVRQGSIFALEPAVYDVGTMFFVAESITARHSEFEKATLSFLRSLKHKAPFAAAFMKGSSGYLVNSYRFPAVAIDENDINSLLAGITYGLEVQVIPTGGNPLRDGYDGMILATGRAGRR